MAIRKAATLDDKQLDVLLAKLAATAHRPTVEKAVFMLSFKAGLRAQEIAGLEWDRHLLDVDGNIRHEEFAVAGAKGRIKHERFPVLWVSADIGKKGSERTLRIHPKLLPALVSLKGEKLDGKFVIPAGQNKSSTDLKRRAHALAIRINRYYALMGYAEEGASKCTSHSGRRTFTTNAARKANFAGCSLKDVQVMVGHKQLSTTEQYIDTTSQQADLIGML
jgi:integrase